MSWSNRQQRLRDILGANSSLCFQLCVGVTRYISDAEEFDRVAEQFNATFDANGTFTLPEKTPEEALFNEGYLYSGSGFKTGQYVRAETLYTQAPYKLKYPEPYEHAAEHLHRLMEVYIPEIEKRFPELHFNGERHAKADTFGVQFQYRVKPYEPGLCHPNELGVFKPITIIGDKIIQPQSTLVQGDQPSTPTPRP